MFVLCSRSWMKSLFMESGHQELVLHWCEPWLLLTDSGHSGPRQHRHHNAVLTAWVGAVVGLCHVWNAAASGSLPGIFHATGRESGQLCGTTGLVVRLHPAFHCRWAEYLLHHDCVYPSLPVRWETAGYPTPLLDPDCSQPQVCLWDAAVPKAGRAEHPPVVRPHHVSSLHSPPIVDDTGLPGELNPETTCSGFHIQVDGLPDRQVTGILGRLQGWRLGLNGSSCLGEGMCCSIQAQNEQMKNLVLAPGEEKHRELGKETSWKQAYLCSSAPVAWTALELFHCSVIRVHSRKGFRDSSRPSPNVLMFWWNFNQWMSPQIPFGWYLEYCVWMVIIQDSQRLEIQWSLCPAILAETWLIYLLDKKWENESSLMLN